VPIIMMHCAAKRAKKPKRLLWLVLFAAVLLAAVIPTSLYLRQLSTEIALSDARDAVTLAISDAIYEHMAEGNYGYDHFVTLEKDASGHVTAITTNMSRINALSNRVLRDVVEASESGVLDISIPLGNLLGLNLMLGRGPDVPVKIVTLTSSYADFRNDLVSVGINQTKHQIILEVVVEIDILIPFQTITAEVVSEILIGETIIMGEVPETYLSME